MNQDPCRRLLLLHSTAPEALPGGRAQLNRVNSAILRDLLRDKVSDFPLLPRKGTARDILNGHIDGISSSIIVAIIERIVQDRCDTVFLDGSNLGAAAAAIRARLPGIRIVTFFHNVEARFFWGAFKARATIKAAAVLAANFVAERKAVRASDVLICLTEHDSNGLKRLYGRGADVIAPMILADVRSASTTVPSPKLRDHGQRTALFVGGGFYANIAGIRWFARHVAPRIELHTRVVGQGMGVLAEEFASNIGMTLVGAVDDLALWYEDTYVVVAPIFDGSGMKTKVAEALMFGKRVIGTPAAFAGYGAPVRAACWECTDADDFVAAFAAASALDLPAFDPAIRRLYDREHSVAAGRQRLADALGVDHQTSDA